MIARRTKNRTVLVVTLVGALLATTGCGVVTGNGPLGERRANRTLVETDGASSQDVDVDATRSEPASSEPPGSGLGLTFAARVAELHRGSLTISDSPLGGARITCRLADSQPTC